MLFKKVIYRATYKTFLFRHHYIILSYYVSYFIKSAIRFSPPLIYNKKKLFLKIYFSQHVLNNSKQIFYIIIIIVM